MWKLSNKNREILYSGFSWLQRDLHCHLLPGIDDGSPDVETSIELIRHLSAAGIREFVCTPHVIQDMFRNTPETIQQALDKLRKAIQQEGLPVRISAAAEYMLDEFFLELLRSGQPLLTLNGKHILTELPWAIQPDNLEELAFEINTTNYHPVLAHPERYAYYHGKKDQYTRLKDLGFSLQMNLLSLLGYYGNHVTTAARYLLKEGMIDFLGTDLHHADHLAALTDSRSVKIFEQLLGDRRWNTFE